MIVADLLTSELWSNNPMKLQIGDTTIELLEESATYEDLNRVQSDTYRLLIAIAAIRSSVEFATLQDLLNLRFSEALHTRLSNLEQKGKLKIQQMVKTTAA